MDINARKRLHPLDTNNIDLSKHIKKKSNLILTRAKSNFLKNVEKKVIMDENQCRRLQIQLRKEIVIIDGDKVLISPNLLLENKHSELQKINNNSFFLSDESSASAESMISDGKSILNIVKSQINNNCNNNKNDSRVIINVIDKELTISPSSSSSKPFIMTDDNNYYYTPSFSNKLYNNNFHSLISQSALSSVYVPKWRIVINNNNNNTRHTRRNSISESTSENLSDEYYLSQHSKYEAEEKKIVKNLQNYSFLSSLNYNKAYDNQNFISPNIATLNRKWRKVVPESFESPLVDGSVLSGDVTVTVRDRVAVTAFGEFLPTLPQRSFSLRKRRTQ